MSSIMLTFILIFLSLVACKASDNSGRYSFSLTTFDPTGKLNQVERASRAAFLGTPVVAICRPDTIYLAAPQALRKLIMDDGTARFAKVSPTIVMAHTGVAADGRIAVAAGQRMAVEHSFTFDEPIPIEVFLEEMSLLFQEYTMKAGARLFGCALVVGSLEENGGTLYRLDPSGAVETLGSHGAVGSLASKLGEQVEQLSSEAKDEDEILNALRKLLDDAIEEQNPKDAAAPDDDRAELATVTAKFTSGSLSVECVDQ